MIVYQCNLTPLHVIILCRIICPVQCSVLKRAQLSLFKIKEKQHNFKKKVAAWETNCVTNLILQDLCLVSNLMTSLFVVS